MNVHDPSVRTGCGMLLEAVLSFKICVRKSSAMSRLCAQWTRYVIEDKYALVKDNSFGQINYVRDIVSISLLQQYITPQVKEVESITARGHS